LNKNIEYSEIGVPQGGTVSPILSNIYLHKFDKFMEALCKKYNRGHLKDNPEYKKLHTRISNLRAYFLPTYR